MPSQFFGLTVATSGLFTYQASLTTTANNISNVQTKGYSKQRAITQASDALRVSAKYGMVGTGVETTAIKQIRDVYYDRKYWDNNCRLGLFERRLYYTRQIETAFADDDANAGFSTLLNKFYNNIEQLSTNSPSSKDVRMTVMTSAQNLCDYFNGMAETLINIQENCNEEIESTVANINAISEKIASLNKQINVIELAGGYANELRDQRALLIDELSEIVPTTTEEQEVVNSLNPDDPTGATNFRVKINGQLLVDTFEYRTLKCEAREEKVCQMDIKGLYDIRWTDVGNIFDVTGMYTTGSLKALFDVRDGNNQENFRGTVVAANPTSITVKNPNQASIDELTLSESGTMTVNHKIYTYSGFDRTIDDNGNVMFKFHLKNPIPANESSSLVSQPMEVGTAIDFMGVPYYMAQLNTYVRSFCEKFNAMERQEKVNDDGTRTIQGVDANGDPMGMFFTGNNLTSLDKDYEFEDKDSHTGDFSAADTYYKLTAQNVQVNPKIRKDVSLIATETKTEQINGVDDYTTIVNGLKSLKNDVTVFRGNSADGFLKCIISDISISTQESEIFYTNYYNISNTIVNQRLSISGVDEDEEGLDLIKFQNAYNLASKMVQTLTEIYDRLILETGV